MIKLKDYLQEKYPDLSRRAIKRALEQGACVINGKIERFATRRIDPNKDKIIYKETETKAKDPLTIKPDRIVFEDEYILVYNKEGGYPSLATKKEERANVHGELKSFISKRDAKENAYIEPVHRLDKDTSGLLIFAKTDQVKNKFFESFREKEIEKEYEAIVDGLLKNKTGTIDNYMKMDRQGKGWQKWMVAKNIDPKNVDPNNPPRRAKHAITHYQTIKSLEDKKMTYLKLSPKTGRTHQLRVHLLHIGHPIIGDTIYSRNFQADHLSPRHLLHASNLKFKHPISGELIKVFAELPEDMKALLQ